MDTLNEQQAADYLNVSREYLTRLVKMGKLVPCRTNDGLRFPMCDLSIYRDQRRRESHDALQNIVELTERYGGY